MISNGKEVIGMGTMGGILWNVNARYFLFLDILQWYTCETPSLSLLFCQTNLQFTQYNPKIS